VTTDPLDRIAELDDREASHFTLLNDHLTQLSRMLATVAQALHDDTAALARIEAIEHQLATLTSPASPASPAGEGGRQPAPSPASPASPASKDGPQPAPGPAWWKLAGPERHEAAAQLRAWVGQVYQPGYGHLAATLGSCWEAHDLCLYGLDILAQLWTVLYLQPTRSSGVLSAQAEYQARILPAIATQLMTETTGCGHDQAPARQPAGHPRSTP
jgi:hypothetical protein